MVVPTYILHEVFLSLSAEYQPPTHPCTSSDAGTSLANTPRTRGQNHVAIFKCLSSHQTQPFQRFPRLLNTIEKVACPLTPYDTEPGIIAV